MLHGKGLNCACGLDGSRVVPQKLQSLRRVLGAIALFTLIEFLGGVASHSLALQADAMHMLMDGLALGLALLATWLVRSSSAHRHNRVLQQRAEPLAASINGIGLLAMSVWIGREAIEHLQGTTTEILSRPMLIVAAVGLLVNGLNLYWLHRTLQHGEGHSQGQSQGQHKPHPGDLNLKAAFLHVMADVLGSVGAIFAACAVGLLHWNWADAAIGLGIAVLIAISAIPLIYQSTKQLLQPPSPERNRWLEVGQVDWTELVQTKTKPSNE